MDVHLSATQPWPGLATYEESSRSYFQGRETEAETLARQIRMAPLTVLYGRSGLGKSSLLKAGVFPLLRAQAFLPVYLRLDFSDQASLDPLAQIAQRLAEEIAAAGLEGPAQEIGESLWHWLHRKDFELWSSNNRLWTPVLVVDQFEELFSRSGGNVRRITEIFAALADLAENRLEGHVADSRRGREALDLNTQRYRMVLSFREDFLPDVRAWRRQVPSLLRNDLRLVPMTREQAIGAVRRAGASVLAPGAAERLVDFVGALGGSSDNAGATLSGPHSQLTIEPALLSLCGAQLAQRLGPGQRIDGALLVEAGQDILEGFYRDALADMPDSVHRFVEDHLLQGDRTRGSYAREEALAQGFITREQLALLTDQRRLLRLAQEGGVQRIELIHDRLVDVVRRARDRRAAMRQAEAAREQDRLEAAERLAAEQAARLAVEQRARAQVEAHARRLTQSRRWLLGAFAGVLVLLGAALWQTYQARVATALALDAAAAARHAEVVANYAKEAAIESARLARERLQQSAELLQSRYGWVGGDAGSADIDRQQEALRADEALRKVRGGDNKAAPAPRTPTPRPRLATPIPPEARNAAARTAIAALPAAAAETGAVRIELVVQDAERARPVVDALRELGYPVSQGPGAATPDAANSLRFGASVPLEDVKVVALALIRAGVKLRAIAPLDAAAAGPAGARLIRLAADAQAARQPLLSVQQVFAAKTFGR